jgi:SpoIID/LytB domain protein
MAQPTPNAGAEEVFTFEGGGWGHSVGMSQFGAYGMAREGHTWQDIVTHYYTGTSVAVADARFTDPPLWVGLQQEKPRVDFLVGAIGAYPVPVVVTRGHKTLVAQPGETVTIEHLGDDRCRVTTPEGALTGGCAIDLEWDGWEASPQTALQLQGCTRPDWNAPGGTVFKPCTYARGSMHIRPDNNTQTVNISLEIDVEDYLLGISESPYGWGSTGGMAALEAQAVTARSYAIHRAVKRGDPENRPWCYCHIYDTPVDQNYVGWGHGTQNWINAVRNTDGMVITHPSETRDGALLPIQAFYSSSTFGWTENSEHGFSQFVPYLRNVDDRWSLDPGVHNHSARWTRQFTASALAARLPGMSTVTGLEVTKCSASGAALEITFTGAGGPRAYSTRDLRGHLALQSMQVIRAGSPLPTTPACPQPGDDGTPTDTGGPVVLAGFTVDDDNDGDSRGNGNGVVECGEVIEVFTQIANQGEALTGLHATLVSNDRLVAIRWNTSSTFPDLAAAGAASNRDDWDLTIAAATPARHQASLTMRVYAANGGPWDLDLNIPIRCGAADTWAPVGIGDIDGNDHPEVVTAVRSPNGSVVLKTRDAATGAVTRRVRIAGPAWGVVAMHPMPDSHHAVAVLLQRDGGATHLVVADLSEREIVSRVQYGKRDAVAMAVLTGVDGATPVYAVLSRLADHRAAIDLRGQDGVRITRMRLRLEPVGMAPLGDLSGSTADEVAVLGVRPSGRSAVITIDLDGRVRLNRRGFGSGEAVAITGVPITGGAADAVAVLQRHGEGARITLADALAGSPLGTTVIPLETPVAIRLLPPLPGSEHPLAILGVAPDGAATAIVLDPRRSRLMAGPVFSLSASPVDLAVLSGFGPSGVTLASLVSDAATGSAIALRDAVTGENLGSLQVP